MVAPKRFLSRSLLCCDPKNIKLGLVLSTSYKPSETVF
jgi:hypothetical protein